MTQDTKGVKNKIFVDFINDLKQYCGSQRSVFLTLYYSLSAAKVKFAKEIIKALDSAINDDVTQLQNISDNIPRSNSTLTTPSYNIFRSFGLATPNSELAGSLTPRPNSAISNSNVEELDMQDSVVDEPDYYEIFRSYYDKLHQLRNGQAVGRLDALIYAMGRTTYLMQWLQRRNINFEMSDLIQERNLSGSFIKFSTNPSDKIYQRTVHSLTYYIACLTFDRALARFSLLKSVPEQYYLGSGVYKAIFHDKKNLDEIDKIRDSLIRYLILLQFAYYKTDQTISERDFTLCFLLREPEYVISTIYSFAKGTKFFEEFQNIDKELDDLGVLKPAILKLHGVATEEFKDLEEDAVFVSQKSLDDVVAPLSPTIYPSPISFATSTQPRVS